LLIVGFGRVTHGRQLVEQAAAAAARAAALDSTPGQAQSDAQTEAADTLADSGVSCQSMHTVVDTSSFHAGGQVSVTVTCVASLADLTVVGFPGHKTLTATSVSPLDQYRQFGDDSG
jgi:Flp pilus assembly protein TadG